MSERGGPTAQSGILYQNSIAALYMGRLCDATARPESERVVQVRSEAMDAVDDIVVTFADGHHAFIQAKENVREGHKAWQGLWKDFAEQFGRDDFLRGRDRLLLQVGTPHDELHELQAACERARTSETYAEWRGRLTQAQQGLVDRTRSFLAPEFLDEAQLREFFGHIDVEIYSLVQIERDLLPGWIPQSSQPASSVFRLLRDRVGGEARVRGTFCGDTLTASLGGDNVVFARVSDMEALAQAVCACGALLRQHKHTIASTGTHLRRGVVDDILAWAASADDQNVAVLLDQAGMGKSVVMRDVLVELEAQGLYVLAIKADQQLSGIRAYKDVQEKLLLPDTVERAVSRLAVSGRVVVLLDQIDALSLSLARDQVALNVAMGLVARLRQCPGVRVLFSCRTFDYESDPRFRSLDVKRQFPLTPLAEEEVRQTLNLAGVDFGTLLPATQQLLRVPLHLDLFLRSTLAQTQEALPTHPITSLQDLYALLWRTVIVAPLADAPPAAEREEVLRQMTERMNREQRTSVPQAMFTMLETGRLQPAVQWLASAGILLRGTTEWNFLHQTFFDYCYARQFVDSGGSLGDTILQGDQGLFARPQLVQVLAYLRGSDPAAYLRELSRLLSAPTLRFHLHDHILRWFGSLPDPSAGEWLIAYRKLVDPVERPRMLQAIAGNPGWLVWLQGAPIRDLLAQNDTVLDTQVLPYLGSLIETCQAEVVALVRPFLSVSDRWNDRLAGLLLMVRVWQTDEAVALFEELVRVHPTLYLRHIYELAGIAKARPDAGCRLVRLVLDRLLDAYMAEKEAEQSSYVHDLPRALEALNGSTIEKTLKSLVADRPDLFLGTMLPWLERVLSLTDIEEDASPFFASDAVSHGWNDGTYVVEFQLIQAFHEALSTLAATNPPAFRAVAARLAKLPFQTAQQLLARAYCVAPEQYAGEALGFLLGDARRFKLGDHEQYESRRLIAAICPFLTDTQHNELEEGILSLGRVYIYNSFWGLGWRGLEQLYLFQAIPSGCRSEAARRYYAELERRFPGRKASADPIGMRGGFIGSPISGQSVERMSDRAWLRTMNKYKGQATHRQDFLKGGARQLSGVLAERVKQDPERFFHLAMEQVPLDVDEAYVTALFSGLAEAECPSEWLFAVISRFAFRKERDIRSSVAWHLKRRVQDGLPDTLTDLLESCVRSPVGEDETWWATQDGGRGGSDRGPYHSYLNSVRGSAFATLMRALDQEKDETAGKRRWELLEFAAADPSTALRAGAVEELLYMLHEDRERAVSLFETLMEGHPGLLRSHYTQDFLYYGMYRHFSQIRPFMCALMEEAGASEQQRGAELVCLASISPLVLVSSAEQEEANQLAAKAASGTDTWRRGAARIYRNNLSRGGGEEDLQDLMQFLEDEDEGVQRIVGSVFRSLRGEHISSQRVFIERFAVSPALHTSLHEFAEFLWQYGRLDPTWALSIVEMALDNTRIAAGRPRFGGGAEFIRLVLRVYTDVTAEDSVRADAMRVFDRLMERYQMEAQSALSEWDRR